MADLLVQIKWHMLSQEKKQETLQRGMNLERKRKYKGVVQEDLFVTNNYGVCLYYVMSVTMFVVLTVGASIQ